jgi:predicted amidohydrolase YtcJ
VNLLIVGGEVAGRAGVDVRIAGGAVADVGVGLPRRRGEEVIDAEGGAVIPGLHDHHVHLRAMAAAAASVPVGPLDTPDAAAFAARLRAAAAPGGDDGGWVRAVGYHESVAGPLDRHRLDVVVPDRPVRVQHRSGAMWVLNTPALDRIGAMAADADGIERDEHGVPTGRLWRLDGWLSDRLPPTPLDLAAVGRTALAHGITGFTDADPARTQADVDLLAGGGLPQRLVLMSAGGLDLGDDGSRLVAGPRKLLLDDATLPPLDELTAWIRRAHADGEAVAVHCVTRLQLVATVTALGEAGAVPGDRIEHGAVVPVELHPELRRLGVTVVTQPNFVAERGDQYRAEVDRDDLAVLYPCAGLRTAGIGVAAGTDAPFGRADPWAAMRAAVQRRTPSGAVLGADERVAPATALSLFLGRPDAPTIPRRIGPGSPADVLILDRPLALVYEALTTADPLTPVAHTVCA